MQPTLGKPALGARLDLAKPQRSLLPLCDSMFQVQKSYRKLSTGTKVTSKLSYKCSNPVCTLLLDLKIRLLGQAAKPEPVSFLCNQFNVHLKTEEHSEMYKIC